MWKFNGKKCLKCDVSCCEYYDTLDLQEADIDNLLSLGFNFDKNIRVDNKGKAVLKLNPCPFLKDDLCIIHNKHGFKYKPLRCQLYPYNPRIINGKVQISLFKGCPAVETGKAEDLSWIEKAYLESFSEYPTMYKLLYGRCLTYTAYADFSKYFWNNADVTKDSMLAFLGYLLLFSREERKILNKDTIKNYFDKDEIQMSVNSLKCSKRAKIAKYIIDIHARIIMKIIGVKYQKDKEATHKVMEDKVMKGHLLNKMLNISGSCLFTNYVMMMPDMYAILKLKNNNRSESLPIKTFDRSFTHHRTFPTSHLLLSSDFRIPTS